MRTNSREVASLYLDDLEIGLKAEKTHVVTDEDIQTFARLTGDYSLLHVDEEFARESRFGRRLAHGLLTASFITGIIGMDLPGRNGIYMSQTLRFSAPVFIGDELTVVATVKEIDTEKSRFRLTTDCMVGDRVVLEGEALIHLPRRPA